jgi:hypothetical protein
LSAIKKLERPGSSSSSSTQPTTSLKEIADADLDEIAEVSSSDSEEEEKDQGFSDEDDDDDDDDDENHTRPHKSKRPDTAKRSKKFKLNDQNNTIKSLRLQQLKHNPNRSKVNGASAKSALNGEEIDIDVPETAKPSRPAKIEIPKNLDEDSNSEEDMPFGRNNRDVQTVKVNQPRKPLPQSENVTTTGETRREAEPATTSELRPRLKSEKEKRIAEMVNSIKEKQKQHELSRRLFDDIKPVIIGGSIFIGGIVLHQLYKAFFK